MKHAIALAAVTLTIALSACGSSDDDPAPSPPVDGSGPTAPGIAEGEPNPSTPGPDGETSMPAPDSDQPPLSSEPGGDTRAVAGYWDGTAPGGDGERYFVIAENGLWTEYFLTYEGDVPGNCYWSTETQTLTPEDPASDAYALADGRSLTLVTDAGREQLTVGFVDENRTETWPTVIGRVVEDLPLCSTPFGPDDETSMPAPDQDVMPLPNEPGGDTHAVAGYWDGAGGDGDERYVVIAENGLWTEYFLTMEGDGATNCYGKLGPQTLMPEDPATGAYRLGDGRALTLVADATGETLSVTFAGENPAPRAWPIVTGRVPEDLPICQTL